MTFFFGFPMTVLKIGNLIKPHGIIMEKWVFSRRIDFSTVRKKFWESYICLFRLKWSVYTCIDEIVNFYMYTWPCLFARRLLVRRCMPRTNRKIGIWLVPREFQSETTPSCPENEEDVETPSIYLSRWFTHSPRGSVPLSGLSFLPLTPSLAVNNICHLRRSSFISSGKYQESGRY